MFDRPSGSAKPAIVLVHGAWADATSWNGVIAQLQAAGYMVYAPPNPLRSLASDAASIAAFVKSIPGNVILVGHSYGGAVISVASAGNPNVKALVYVDGFALDAGESCLSVLPSESAAPRRTCSRPVPLATGGDVDLYFTPKYLRRGFCVGCSGGRIVAHGGDATSAHQRRAQRKSAGGTRLEDDPVVVRRRRCRPRDPAGGATHDG